MAHGRPLALLLLAAGLLVAIPAQRAHADTIRLRDGTVLTAAGAEVLDGRIRVLTLQDGAVVPVEFPFGRFAPRTVLKLLDKTTDQTDAKQRLRGARIAIEIGLPEEARKRFRAAARIDPALKAEADQGLDELRFAEATRAFTELEQQLREGKDPEKVHAALDELVIGPHALYLSVSQLKRIAMLSKLAKRLADRADGRKADADKKNKPRKPERKPAKPPVPDKPPPRRDTDVSPYAPGSYADERWRKRRGDRLRPPPNVPGRERPPLQGKRGPIGGGNPGSPNGGQKSGGSSAPGGVRGGQGGGSPPGGSSGGGQGTGLER